MDGGEGVVVLWEVIVSWVYEELAGYSCYILLTYL